ncbi:MAG: hypothetical protein EBQ94_07405 [Flavobacteriales bacterium]|nr:hypothetical protein [Crocinitomicaceae bacterium]NBX80190.1 hypothetical protein [Flavobacteriales bacterium]NCA22288.1 hypothetical protein [Crocinitomicaceae bacterium]
MFNYRNLGSETKNEMDKHQKKRIEVKYDSIKTSDTISGEEIDFLIGKEIKKGKFSKTLSNFLRLHFSLILAS